MPLVPRKEGVQGEQKKKNRKRTIIRKRQQKKPQKISTQNDQRCDLESKYPRRKERKNREKTTGTLFQPKYIGEEAIFGRGDEGRLSPPEDNSTSDTPQTPAQCRNITPAQTEGLRVE